MNTRLLPVVLALLTAALVCLAPAAHAQTQEAQPPVWVQGTIAQLGASLDSPAAAVRHDAMQHLAYFAYFYKDGLDFADILPTLLTIYQEDPDERARLFAIAALHAIGDEETLQRVRRHASVALGEDDSPRVQLVTLAALMQHYGAGTFEGDEEAAKLAKELLEYYTGPRVIVEPPVIIDSDRR